MTYLNVSRDLRVEGVSETHPRHVGQVIERIRHHPGLKPHARNDLIWGLGVLLRGFGKAPEEMLAQPHVISRQRRKIIPATIGLTPEAWSNAVSLAIKAFELTGCYVHPGKFHAPLSTPWDDLLKAITNKYIRYGVARFVHFANDKGWPPDQIGPAAFDRFREYLETVVFATDPERAYLLAIERWNQAVKQVSGWPQNPIPMPRKPRKHDSYWIDWSETSPELQAEVAAFKQSCREIDYFAEDAAEPLSEETIKNYDNKLRAFVSALQRRGRPIPTHLRMLVEPATFKEGLRFFLERNDGETCSNTSGVAAAGYAVARYLANRQIIDAKQLAEVKAIYKKVKFRQKGLAQKNKELLRLFHDQRNVAKMLFLPAHLAAGLSPHRKPTVRQAQAVEIATAVEILTVFPIREGNLAALHLENNIVRAGPHKNAEVLIVIPGEGVKNGEDLEVKLPRESAELLDLYIKHCLPVLAPGGTEWLFPSRKGGHKHAGAFGAQIKRVIFRKTALPIHVHFFRHLSAKFWLDRHPGQFSVIQRALGHRSLKTTMTFYAEFNAVQALAIFDEHILELRRELAHLADPRGYRRKSKKGT
jgi:integrase